MHLLVEFKKEKIAPTILDSVRSIDFTADKVTIAEKLNEIIEKNTQNRISGYFTAADIADSSNIIISSSAFFTGHWANNFENYVYQPFVLDSLGKTIANVKFLTTSNYFKYGEGDNYQIIEIPYEGYRYSLILILPKNVENLAEFENIFNYDNYQLWRKNSLQGQPVRLLMPEFEVENFYNLTSRYDTVTPAIYQKGGNFLNLIKKVVFITGFYHYAKFTVAQESRNITEIKRLNLAKEKKDDGVFIFNANHPFIFLVIDRRTQAILFIGHYYQPPQNND